MFQVVSLEAGEMGKLPEQTDGAKEPYPVPKELWFLCDIMTSLGLSKENLFLQVRERNSDKCHQYLKKPRFQRTDDFLEKFQIAPDPPPPSFVKKDIANF